jgi:hypothetical protein
MSYKQKIYFACSGTDCNDIINSLNPNPLKIKEEEFCSISEIGIREMALCQKNSYIKENILNKERVFPKIYTGLEKSNIDSSLVLFSSLNDYIEVNPISILSKKSKVKKTNYKKFKEEFPESKFRNKYWNKRLDLDNFNKKIPIINWTYTDKNQKFDKYNFNSFKIFLYQVCANNIKNKMTMLNTHNKYELQSIVFILDGHIISDILKYMKYKIDYTIENSSVWQIDMTIIDNSLSGRGYLYTQKDYKKIYPTKFNHSPLKYESSKFTYRFNNKDMMLFDSLSKKIPLEYLKMLKFILCKDSDKIKKTVHGNNINKKENRNNNSKNNINNNITNNDTNNATNNNSIGKILKI